MVVREERGRVKKILSTLKKLYPDARCVLNFTTPLQLLVATILSAQCTDERVNAVTERLFKKYRTARDFSGADIRELESDIRPTGFFRNKAKLIHASSTSIAEKFGKVPDTMEEILTLPGVARKTANVVLGNAYGVVEGIAVDTHVSRLAQRLRLTQNKNPEKIERDLMEIVPRKDWLSFSHLLQFHGRRACRSQNPRCAECTIARLCPSRDDYAA